MNLGKYQEAEAALLQSPDGEVRGFTWGDEIRIGAPAHGAPLFENYDCIKFLFLVPCLFFVD